MDTVNKLIEIVKSKVSIDNRRILGTGLNYTVTDTAPEGFEALKTFVTQHGYIPVWSGGSENTIFGTPEVNYAFRAWHDSVHLELNVGFDLEGETVVAIEMSKNLPEDVARLIWIEVVEQAKYYFETGNFPVNQVEFTLNKLKQLELNEMKSWNNFEKDYGC